MGWGWGREDSYAHGNLISGNRINGTMRVLSDGGSIYTLGPQDGSEVTENYITSQNGGGNCLYHDNGSSGFHTHKNVIDMIVGEGGACQSVFINSEDVASNPDPYIQTVLVDDNWFKGASNYTDNCPEGYSDCVFDWDTNVFLEDGEDFPDEAVQIANDAGPRSN